jgi:hypothetical protein
MSLIERKKYIHKHIASSEEGSVRDFDYLPTSLSTTYKYSRLLHHDYIKSL